MKSFFASLWVTIDRLIDLFLCALCAPNVSTCHEREARYEIARLRSELEHLKSRGSRQ